MWCSEARLVVESPPRLGRAPSLGGFTPGLRRRTRVGWRRRRCPAVRRAEGQPGALGKCSTDSGSCAEFGRCHFSVQLLKKGVPSGGPSGTDTEAQSSSSRVPRLERKPASRSSEGHGLSFGHGTCCVTLRPRWCQRPAPAGADPAGSAGPPETDEGSLAGPPPEQHTSHVTAAH